jgi:hypothetical protein
MSCQSCDKSLAPNKQPRNRWGIRFGDWWVTVWRYNQRLDDVYEVQVPDRAWRYRVPVARCRCGEGFDCYVDTNGPFAVKTSRYAPGEQ